MREISKAQLLGLLESNSSIDYVGRMQMATDMRLYYRLRVEDEPVRHEVVYVVE